MPAPAKKPDKPADIKFNFDTYQRDVPVEPFPIVIGGKRYESIDPLDLDFRRLNAILDNPSALFRELFPTGAEEILANERIPIGALGKFVEAVSEHFGLRDFIGALS